MPRLEASIFSIPLTIESPVCLIYSTRRTRSFSDHFWSQKQFSDSLESISNRPNQNQICLICYFPSHNHFCSYVSIDPCWCTKCLSRIWVSWFLHLWNSRWQNCHLVTFQNTVLVYTTSCILPCRKSDHACRVPGKQTAWIQAAILNSSGRLCIGIVPTFSNNKTHEASEALKTDLSYHLTIYSSTSPFPFMSPCINFFVSMP